MLAPSTPSAIHATSETVALTMRQLNRSKTIPVRIDKPASKAHPSRKERELPAGAIALLKPSTMPQTKDAAIATAGSFTERVSIAPVFQCGRFAGTDRTG